MKKFNHRLFVAYLLLALTALLFHEPWRDELQSFIIARHSHSLSDLLYNSRCEGHPSLWYILNFIIAKIFSKVFFLQFLHYIIASTGIYLFIYYSPFEKKIKLLYVFSYLAFFEYTVISRHYSLGITAIILLTVLYKHRYNFRKLLIIMVLLAFLTYINIYSLIISIVFITMLLCDITKTIITFSKKQQLVFFLLFIFFISSIYISLRDLIPAEYCGYAYGWNFRIDKGRIVKVLTVLWDLFYPLPQKTIHYWEYYKNLLAFEDGSRLNYIRILLSFIISVISFIIFRKHKKSFFLFFGSVCGILLFSYIKMLGFNRHYGHIFILFFSSLWLYYEAKGSIANQKESNFLKKIQYGFIYSFLITQLLANLYSLYHDIRYPFSQSSKVAEYMVSEKLDNYPIVADKDYATSPVTAYIDSSLFFPSDNVEGTYIFWNLTRTNARTIDDVMYQVQRISNEKNSPVTVLLNYEADSGSLQKYPGLELIQNFEPAIIVTEEYFLYLYRK